MSIIRLVLGRGTQLMVMGMIAQRLKKYGSFDDIFLQNRGSFRKKKFGELL